MSQAHQVQVEVLINISFLVARKMVTKGGEILIIRVQVDRVVV